MKICVLVPPGDTESVIVTLQDGSGGLQQQKKTLQTMAGQMVQMAELVLGAQTSSTAPPSPPNSSGPSDSSVNSEVDAAPPKKATKRKAVAPKRPSKSKEVGTKAAKEKLVRKPYKFCVYCWISTGEWILKALTAPDASNIQLGSHTQRTCPRWQAKTEATPEQHRAYGAAFKRAVRQNTLHNIAYSAFQEKFPEMSDEEIAAHMMGRSMDTKTAMEDPALASVSASTSSVQAEEQCEDI